MANPKIGIELTAQDKTRAAFESAENNLSGLKKSATSISTALSSIGVGLSMGAVVGKLISVQREFDILNSSLITVTGSSAAAEKEFAWIREFAATTPYSLNEVTDAFVRMKSLGMDASEKALRSYGNTASAMGKSLNQMIEAVADAGTGEFERLKEFGIKARKQGDDVTLTFQGVTTKLKNNAEDISRYLQSIGNVQFAGAMAERAKTLDGALSNLGDTWDSLYRSIYSSDVGSLISESVAIASKAISELDRIISLSSPAGSEHAKSVDEMSLAYESFAKVAQTLSVIGSDLSFVFRVLANDVISTATATGYAMTLQFGMAKKTMDQAAAYAKSQRAILDEYQKSVLDGKTAAKPGGTGASSASPNPSRPGTSRTTSRSSGGKADPLASLLGQTETGILSEYTKNLALVEARYKANKLGAEQYAEALLILNERLDESLGRGKSPQIDEAFKAQIASQNAGFDLSMAVNDANIEQAEREAAALGALREQYVDMIDPLERYRQQLEEIEILREKGLLTTDQSLAAGMMVNEAMQRELDSVKDANLEASDFVAEAWKSAAQNIQSALADFLFDPFKEGLDGMLEGFVNTLRRIAAEAAAAQIMKEVLGWGVSQGGWIGELAGAMSKGIQGKASGGPVSGGTPYLIGEKGPELFIPGQSGMIVPNHRLAGAGINQSITINVSTPTGTLSRDSLQQLQTTLGTATARALRRNT